MRRNRTGNSLVRAYTGAVDGMRMLIVAALLAIVASLAVALYYLASGRDDSNRMVHALALRVTLSIALFVLLILAWRFGLIAPHGIQH